MALSCSKRISALLHGITSKHKCDFYCLNCLNSYLICTSFFNLNPLKKYVKIKIFVEL